MKGEMIFPMKPDIFQQIDGIRELPTLPAIVLKVNQMLQDLETTADQLSRAIETDQAMTAKILKLVNSSFYGFKSTIGSISTAVIILGFNTVQHAVVSLSVMKSFALQKNLKKLNIQDFWRHSLSVAIVSKHLADHSHKALSSDCFTGGLLHDIGKLILAAYFPEHFEKIWLTTVASDISFVDAEKIENGPNHAEIGAYLAEKWLLPQPLVDAIRHHHSAFFSDHRASAIIGTADLLVNTCRPEAEGRIPPQEGLLNAPAFLQPQLQVLSGWYPRLQAEIASACQFFMETQG